MDAALLSRRGDFAGTSPISTALSSLVPSLVCVRAGGDAVVGAPQFRCKLWVEVEGNKENLALVTSMVASSNLSGGFVAAEQGMFLAVPLELLHDESGEAPALMVRIDRAGAAAATASARSPSATPPSKLPKRLQ
nr:uncharacterized protein LOC117849239 [Setaria viridis]